MSDDGQLFDPSTFDAPAEPPATTAAPEGTVVRVQPDETAVDKTFDYVVPDEIAAAAADGLHVGDRIRVDLGGRRVAAWITEIDPPDAILSGLKPATKWSSIGPDASLVELARWAQRRWVARSPVPFLRTASPERTVARRPRAAPSNPPAGTVADDVVADAFAQASARNGPGVAVLRLAPAEDRLGVVLAAAARGDAVVVVPTRAEARALAVRARRAGAQFATHPEDWVRAAGGSTSVIGTRAATWSPIGELAAVVVLDEHDESHQEEGSPTWHARDVAVERARRAGVPCVLVSPMPSAEALAVGPLVAAARGRERHGWPAVVVADRREDDAARNGLVAPALAEVIRSGARVVCVLNTKGRAALLRCRQCRSLARCERCDGAVARPGPVGDEGVDGALACRRCGHVRPVVCTDCGSVDLVTARMGVQRVAEDLTAFAREEVLSVTAETRPRDLDRARIVVGTEAVLHQAGSADVVAFLDLDQELLAPRAQAAEQALALVVRAARLVPGRRPGAGRSPGRLVLQTSMPEHHVVQAAVLGDPSRVSAATDADRQLFGFPPYGAIAEIGGQAAAAFVDRIPEDAPVQVQGPRDGRWLVRAADHDTLVGVLGAVPRPPGRLRLAVDPPRI